MGEVGSPCRVVSEEVIPKKVGERERADGRLCGAPIVRQWWTEHRLLSVEIEMV